MAAKVKPSRLESEIEKCRAECSWQRALEFVRQLVHKSPGFGKSSLYFQFRFFLCCVFSLLFLLSFIVAVAFNANATSRKFPFHVCWIFFLLIYETPTYSTDIVAVEILWIHVKFIATVDIHAVNLKLLCTYEGASVVE